MIAVRLRPGEHPKKCRSCGAEVWWGRTEKGKFMIVDRDPVAREQANILLLEGRETVEQAGLRAVYHQAHRATCPYAAEWKR
jgi:hypothetical protein